MDGSRDEERLVAVKGKIDREEGWLVVGET